MSLPEPLFAYILFYSTLAFIGLLIWFPATKPVVRDVSRRTFPHGIAFVVFQLFLISAILNSAFEEHGWLAWYLPPLGLLAICAELWAFSDLLLIPMLIALVPAGVAGGGWAYCFPGLRSLAPGVAIVTCLVVLFGFADFLAEKRLDDAIAQLAPDCLYRQSFPDSLLRYKNFVRPDFHAFALVDHKTYIWSYREMDFVHLASHQDAHMVSWRYVDCYGSGP